MISNNFKFIPLKGCQLKKEDLSFNFDGEMTLFQAANKVAAFMTKQKLIETSPFIVSDPLSRFKFKQVTKDKTILWSVKDNEVQFETQNGKFTVIKTYKTSEAPKLKDIFTEGTNTIEFSFPGMVIEKSTETVDTKTEVQSYTDGHLIQYRRPCIDYVEMSDAHAMFIFNLLFDGRLIYLP